MKLHTERIPSNSISKIGIYPTTRSRLRNIGQIIDPTAPTVDNQRLFTIAMGTCPSSHQIRKKNRDIGNQRRPNELTTSNLTQVLTSNHFENARTKVATRAPATTNIVIGSKSDDAKNSAKSAICSNPNLRLYVKFSYQFDPRPRRLFRHDETYTIPCSSHSEISRHGLCEGTPRSKLDALAPRPHFAIGRTRSRRSGRRRGLTPE